MDYPVQALTDAATIYAAGRFIANDYEGGIGHYMRMDDEIYYYEFLHNIVLYDRIIYDNSSLETATADEIRLLIKAINEANRLYLSSRLESGRLRISLLCKLAFANC